MGNGSCFVVTPVLSEPAVEIANDEKINIILLATIEGTVTRQAMTSLLISAVDIV